MSGGREIDAIEDWMYCLFRGSERGVTGVSPVSLDWGDFVFCNMKNSLAVLKGNHEDGIVCVRI